MWRGHVGERELSRIGDHLGAFRISQEQAEKRTERDLRKHGQTMPPEFLRCIEAEMRGGDCPCGCGQSWAEVEVDHIHGSFTYYEPPRRGCNYPSCPRCRAHGEHRVMWEYSIVGSPLECSCGWKEKRPEASAPVQNDYE